MQIDRPITISLILFAILLLAFFLVVPEYKMFIKLQTDLGEKKAEYRAEFDYYSAIEKVYSDLQGREEDLKTIDDALPTDPALGKLIYFLQKTAKDDGLTVKNLFLSKSAPSSAGVGTKEVSFSMDLMGSYSSLGSFISSLEKSSRIFEVSNISFGASSVSSRISGGAGQLYNFSLQIKTHSY